MKKIIFLTLIFAALFFMACADTFEFELPEENSIVDETPPSSLFTIGQKSEDWQTITITNLSTNALSYEWNFGDGNTLTTTNESQLWFDYTFDTNEPTEYTITLTASDALDATDTYSYTFVLRELLSSLFEVVQSDAGLTGDWQRVNFTNLSEGAESYLWEFGDGNTSTQFEPEHTYDTDEEATYTIKLTATNASGETEVYTNFFSLIKPKSYLVPDIFDGGFERGDSDDYKDENGNAVDDPIGDSRDSWRSGFDRLEGETSVLQISSSAFEGEFGGKLPAVEDDNDYRLGYQELELTENINYRITYTYSINNNFNENGILNFAVVKPMNSWDQLTSNTIAINVHEELNQETGFITTSLDFNTGDNTTLAILFYNQVEEVIIDSIQLEGLD